VLRFAWLPRLQQLALTDNALPNVWPLPVPPRNGDGYDDQAANAAAAAAEAPPPPPGTAADAAAAGADAAYVPKIVDHAAAPKAAITGADRYGWVEKEGGRFFLISILFCRAP
jgi:hypothetical protein